MISISNVFNQVADEVRMYIEDEVVRYIIEYIAETDTFTEKEIKRKIKEKFELKLRDADIRKILYKLEEYGIIYPIEATTIDVNKYDYRWGVKIKNLYDIYNLLLKDHIEKLIEIESQQSPTVYYCEECMIHYSVDDAYDNNFKCKECGGILVEKENPILINARNLNENIRKFLESIKKKKKYQKAKTSKKK